MMRINNIKNAVCLAGALFGLLFSPAIAAEIVVGNNASSAVSSDFLQGVRYQSLGATQHATLLFAKVVKADPQHAAAYFRLSQLAQRQGNDDASFEAARRAYQIDPEFRPYADQYARHLIRQGDYAGAGRIFEDLTHQDPGDVELLGMLAMLRFEQGDMEQALALVDTAELRGGGIREQLAGVKREALIRLERYREAYDYMRVVTQEFPEEAGFQVHFAELAAALREDSIALVHYKRAIELDPFNLGTSFSLAEYYRIKGLKPAFYETLIPLLGTPRWPIREKTAYFLQQVWGDDPQAYGANLPYTIRMVDALVNSAPDDVDVQRIYAQHLVYSDQGDKGWQVLADLVEQGRANLGTYTGIIQMALLREEPEAVDKYARLAEAKYPHDEQLQLFLLYVQLQQQDTTAALSRVRQLIRNTANDSLRASAYVTYADLSYLRGDHRTAFRSYEQALKILPDDATLLNNYAYYLSLERRDLDRALEMSTRANALERQNPIFLDTQAWILYELGQYAEAQTLMRQALAMIGQPHSEMLMHYGDILQAMGQRAMAETYWKRALEAGADKREVERRLSTP